MIGFYSPKNPDLVGQILVDFTADHITSLFSIRYMAAIGLVTGVPLRVDRISHRPSSLTRESTTNRLSICR